MTASRASATFSWAVLLGSAALAAALLLPGLLTGPSLDAAVFADISHRMRSGATLYVDAWDHKPPGIYLILWAGQSMLPFLAPWSVSWLLSVAAIALTALFVSSACMRLGLTQSGSALAGLATVVLQAQYLVALGGGLTEIFAATPIAGAMLLTVGRIQTFRSLLAIGVLMGISVLISVQVLPAAIVIAAYLVMPTRQRILSLATLAAGSGAVLVLAVIWLASSGAAQAAFDAVVAYASAYRSTGIAAGLTLTAPVMAWTLLAWLVAFGLAAIGALDARRSGAMRRSTAAVCGIWILASVCWFAFQARFFAHYAAPLVIPLGLLVGIGIDRILQIRPRPVIATIVLTAAVSLVAAVIAGGMEWKAVANDNQRATAVAERIKSLSGANDSIWVWGNKPQLYLFSERRHATDFDYLYPLVTPGYGSSALVDRTLADLMADPPVVIVDAGSPTPGAPGFQPLLVSRPVATDGRDLDLLDPLRSFVRERYRRLNTVAGWILYQRIDR